jgi:hypothetical protein
MGVGIAQSVKRLDMGWTTHNVGVIAPCRCKIFLFPKSSRPTLGPTQPPIQWVPWASFPVVKRPRRETDHSPQTNAEVKNTCIYIYPLLHTSSGPPLWSSGQSSWLHIQRSRVRFPELSDFLRSSGSGTGFTQFRELLGRNSSGSGLENREYGLGDPLRLSRDTLYPQKLANFADIRRSLGRYISLAD